MNLPAVTLPDCEPFRPVAVFVGMPTNDDSLSEVLDQQALKHLRDLGFTSVVQYRQWCFEQGFSRGLNKHSSLRAVELEVRAARQRAGQRQRLRESRQPETVLLAICRGELHEEDIEQPVLRRCARSIQQATTSTSEPLSLAVLEYLCSHLQNVRAKILAAALQPRQFLICEPELLYGLLTISQQRHLWIRPLESWRPRCHNARRQLASLLRHLFAKYDDVPLFMDRAWLALDESSRIHRQWYMHLGQGQNLRHCQLPIAYTKRMAHYFMRAPDKLSITQALRYGQVLGLGGDVRTAQSILSTRLGSHLEHDSFWQTVVRWFIEHPLLDRVHTGPIIDYIHFHKFASDQLVEVSDRTVTSVRAPQANFTMRGRTPQTLLRQVQRWHGQLANDNRVQLCQWSPLPIDALDLVEGAEADARSLSSQPSLKRWTIRELLSSQALIAEGKLLGHCVASYASSCQRRQTSIWTLELANASSVTKLLTLELHPQSRTIVQARGRFNRFPTEQELKIIQRWAGQAGLRLGPISG